MALAVAEARADGVNVRTSSKDAFALREFTYFAELTGFDPNLRTAWTRSFPERESLKLASFLLFRAQRAIPRSKVDVVAKPMSVYQNYLALRRVFRSRDVELPASSVVKETLRGLLRRFVRRFGVEALRPKRVEPVTPDIVLKVLRLAQAGTSKVASLKWDLSNWECFIAMAWMAANLSIGTRNGESTKLPGDVDENDYFNRASVSADVHGDVQMDPPTSVWKGMNEGCFVHIAPGCAKCDQYGSCHGTEPIILPYHDEELNAAKWICDIEVRYPVHGAARRTTPLFADRNGEPFTNSRFSSIVNAALEHVLGKARAKLLSTHSWRVWIASALRMCDASDARIQAMGRWLNPESIKIYSRMSKEEYAKWVDKLMSVRHINTARTTSLPVMDIADAVHQWRDELGMRGDLPSIASWRDEKSKKQHVPPPVLKPNDRIEVYWTDMREWFPGTFTSSRVEQGDDGNKQRSSRIVYDRDGVWSRCTVAQSTYWHCLDDEQWHRLT